MKKNLSDIKKESFLANLALLILFPYSFLTGLTMMQGVHIIYPAVVLSIVVYAFVYYTCKDRRLFVKLLTLLAIVLVFLLLNVVIVGNSDLKNVIYGVFILPCLGTLLFFYKVNRWAALILFYEVSAFFCVYIIENGPFIREETELLTNSRNYVSYFVILYSLPYFIYCHDYNKIPSLIIPVICVIISLFAIGRSGILASLVLLSGVVYLKMFQRSKIRIVYRLLFVGLILFISVVGISDDFGDIYFSRFSEEGINSAGRTPAWNEYVLSMLNPINMLFGTPINTLSYTTKYLDGSLHNSYFTLHAREGIVGFVLIVYMFKGAWVLFKKKYFPLFLIMAVLLLKGFTDADMGGAYSGGDIYVFYLVLVYLYFKSDKKNERKSIGAIPSSVSSDS